MKKIVWLLILLFLLLDLTGCQTASNTDNAVEAFSTPSRSQSIGTPRQGQATLQTLDPIATMTVLQLPIVQPGIASQTAAQTITPGLLATEPVPTRTNAPNQPPTRTVTSTLPRCLAAGGHYDTGSLNTSLLKSPLEYRLYLPPCYAENPKQRYPVLYLFHGQSFKDDQWDRIGADETADRLIASGKIPPLIIVMPYEHVGGQPPETHFADAVVKVLVPHIDQKYRTKAEREYRAVGGLSRGGGWAIHFAIVHWDLFGVLGAHSPAVFYNDAEKMRSYLDALPEGFSPRIYIDIGERDRPEILRAAIWFEGLLNEKNFAHEWHLFAGYHNEAYWSEHMEQYLFWYTRGW